MKDRKNPACANRGARWLIEPKQSAKLALSVDQGHFETAVMQPRLLELDPLYVHVAHRRWVQIAAVHARHSESGLTFIESAVKRRIDKVNSLEPGRRKEA
jgi:hypothetical protein